MSLVTCGGWEVNIRLKKELDTTNKNLSEIAKEVIDKLTSAGYNYSQV